VIGEPRDFGRWGYLAGAMVPVLLATLADHEGFYGSPPQR
jgi:hypothetical protein